MLAALRLRVVVVSFNPSAAVATRWDSEVYAKDQTPFTHVFSAGANGAPGPLYHALGFRRSFAGVWGPASINFYAEQKQGGRELHPALGQDVHMLSEAEKQVRASRHPPAP